MDQVYLKLQCTGIFKCSTYFEGTFCNSFRLRKQHLEILFEFPRDTGYNKIVYGFLTFS